MANHPTTSRVDELLAQAGAMLELDPAVWKLAGFPNYWRAEISASVSKLRQAEYNFCAALTARLNVIVHRQATDREGWDFIAGVRDLLRARAGQTERLAPQTGGLGPIPLQIPDQLEDRVKTLRELSRMLAAQPEMQDRCRGLTGTRAKQLANQLTAALGRIEQCRRDLRRKAQARHHALKCLHRAIQSATHEVQRRLRQSDPRWLTLWGTMPPTAHQNSETESRHRARNCAAARQQRSTSPSSSQWGARLSSPEFPELQRAKRSATRFGAAAQVNPNHVKLTSLLAWVFPPAS